MTPQRRRFVARPITTPEPEQSSVELDNVDAEFAIHCPRKLLQVMKAFATRHRTTEVFGLLAGRPVITPSKRLRTMLEDFIPAEAYMASNVSYVEVSAKELLRMHEIAEQRGHRPAGWFHTHPGHGIFMSGTDRANHRIYTLPWQVALVLDPQQETWGFFRGTDCRSVPPEHVIHDPIPAPREEHSGSASAAQVELVGPKADSRAESSEDASEDKQAVSGEKRGNGEEKSAEKPEPAASASAAATPVKTRLGAQVNRGLAGALILTVCLFVGMTVLLRGKLVAQQLLLEEDTVRIRDLQLRIEEISKRPCAQE